MVKFLERLVLRPGDDFLLEHPYHSRKIEDPGEALKAIRPGDVVIVNSNEVEDVYPFARQLSGVDVFTIAPTRPPTPTDGKCVRGYLNLDQEDSVEDLKRCLLYREEEEPEPGHQENWALVCGTGV